MLQSLCLQAPEPGMFFPGRGVLKLLMKAKLEEKANNNPNKYKALGGCWTSCDDVSDKNNASDANNEAPPPPPPPPPGYDDDASAPTNNAALPPQSTMSAMMARVSGGRKHHRHHHHHHKKRSKSQKGSHKQLVNESDGEEPGTPHRPRSTENLLGHQKQPADRVQAEPQAHHPQVMGMI
jgi:hypothetical protein